MQVSKINPNKVKIALTDTEVLCCFSSYEKLFRMDNSTKTVIKALLREITAKHCRNFSKISVTIHAGKNLGCIMILSPKTERKNQNYYIFEFYNSENLIKAAIYLDSKTHRSFRESSLYKMPESYRLIIKSRKTEDDFFVMNEFCDKIHTTEIKLHFTAEYGKMLIKENAVKTLSKAFKGS